MMDKVNHPFPPLFDKNSKILMLGSFPSVKSREQKFFYGHPKNRFWSVLAKILNCPIPETIEQKKMMLYNNGIALWDVIASCEIEGSSDSSIKNAVPNDLSVISPKGKGKHYAEYTEGKIGMKAVCLPSTSPANASWSVDKLTAEWERLLEITTLDK